MVFPPIRSVRCVRMFFTLKTRALWFTSRLNELYTTEDASVKYGRIILFPRNKREIGNKRRAVLSTNSIFFPHSNATLLLCLTTNTVMSTTWPRCHVQEPPNKTLVAQMILMSRWPLFSIPTSTSWFNWAPISMFIPMKTEKKWRRITKYCKGSCRTRIWMILQTDSIWFKHPSLHRHPILRQSFDRCLKHRQSNWKHGNGRWKKNSLLKLFITDSANSHLNSDTIGRLRRCSVVVAIIPKGTTMSLQVLDVSVFSVFKKHYYDVAEEWLDVSGPRSKVKLTSSQSRILCTRLTKSAWCHTLKSIDFETVFREIGYTWRDDSPIYSRTLAGFCFDPSSMNLASDSSSDNFDDEKIERDAEAASKESGPFVNWKNRGKQTKLGEYWKCWFYVLLFRYFYLFEIEIWNTNVKLKKTAPIGWSELRGHIIRPPLIQDPMRKFLFSNILEDPGSSISGGGGAGGV